jgi:isopenicillin-N epimerase
MALYREVEKQLRDENFQPELLDFELEFLELLQKDPPTTGEDCKRELFPDLNELYFAHGSYGACYKPISDLCNKWRIKMEQDPNHFYYKMLYPKLVHAIKTLAQYVNCPAQNLLLIPNVEYGISSILNSLDFTRDDKIICFDFQYEAVRYAIEHRCKQTGAQLVVVETSLPLTNTSIVSDMSNFLACYQGSIKLAVIEHITSPTAILLPIESLIHLCKEQNILVLVDGAHTAGCSH